MKNLKTLIKLHKNYVDSTLKEIAKLNGNKELMEKRLLEISENMNLEAEKFASTEYGFALDVYLTDARDATGKLKQNISRLDTKILEAQLLLHDQFSELKKFEIALQNRQNELKEAENAAEIKEIDEINIQKFA